VINGAFVAIKEVWIDMGPAVNRAARLKNMTTELGCRLLVSGDVARSTSQDTNSRGFHNLKGVAAPPEIFELSSIR